MSSVTPVPHRFRSRHRVSLNLVEAWQRLADEAEAKPVVADPFARAELAKSRRNACKPGSIQW